MRTYIQKILTEYKWLILTGLGLTTILISSYGLSIEYGKTGIKYSYLDLLYLQTQDVEAGTLSRQPTFRSSVRAKEINLSEFIIKPFIEDEILLEISNR